MKVPQKSIRNCFVTLLFILTIIFAKDVVVGAAIGIELCLRVVIPSIFPLLLLSLLLCQNCGNNDLFFTKPLCRFVHIPQSAASILILAILGGYPVGAQAVTTLYKNKQLNKYEAQRMLAFCNNAGPAFIFGLLGSNFSNKYASVLLWIIHIGSALLVGHIYKRTPKSNRCNIINPKDQNTPIMRSTVITMGIICGWIILFRTIIYILQPLISSHFHENSYPLIFGFFELTNGCILLKNIPFEYERFVLASALLSMGGLCVGLQTRSITGELGFGQYIPGKIVQTCISVILSYFVCYILYGTPLKAIPVLLCLTVLIAIHFIFIKKVVAL